MTANQTIGGVPRELIQWLVDHEDHLDFGGREHELRALLKAKPKAEPVAYLCKASGSKWLQYGARVSDPWRPEEVELTPLYAEQPAPLAVVLPESVELFRDILGWADSNTTWHEIEVRIRAHLDEVTRLNTK